MMDELRLKNIAQFSKEGVLDEHSRIGDALKIIFENSISSVIVVNKQNIPIGIFTEYDALKIVAQNGSKESLLVEVMSPDPFTVSDNIYLHDAYLLLSQKGYEHLIVVNEKKEYLGVVSEGDFLRFMGFEHLGQHESVEQIMDKTPLLVEFSLTVQEVAKQMNMQHSKYAVVVQNRKPLGIIAERTIAHYFANTSSIKNKEVGELIDSKLYFVSKDIPLQEAAKLLTKHGTHQLIVVDEDENVIGLVKRNDILKAVHGSYFEFLISTIEKKSRVLENLLQEQKQLLDKSHLLNTVINTIPDLIWLKDIDGKYLTCNHMFERFFNASAAQLLGKRDDDFVSKELADPFHNHDLLAIEMDEAIQNEQYLVFNDGSYEGTFETVKTPVKDGNGKTFAVLGIARDISERKRREKELEERDSEFRFAEELAHVGSWTWDIKNNRIRCSDETRKIFGIAFQENATFESLMHIVHPEDIETVKTNFKIANQTGIYNLTHRIIVDDQIKWINSSAKFLQDETGKFIKVQGMLQDITMQKSYELELERLANYDALTNLANRTYLLAHLQKLLHRNRRNNNNAAVLLFDLDHFRDINDSFGHNIGDELLIQVGQRMSDRIRQEDFLAHLSGDEYVLVLEKLKKKEDVTTVVEEMIEVLSQPFFLSNNIEVRIGVSIGIVLIPQDIMYENELLQFADAALFQAKKEGRNCYRFYSNELTTLVQERIQYQNEIFYALQNNEFEMYYQPQVHIETNRVIGVEALIRWNHPIKGIVNPSVFIPIAEESGLIAHIGAWTLQEACKQGKKWHDEGYDLHVSVNVSMQQFRHQNLVDIVNQALQESRFSPDKLILELTESAMMKHEDELASTLHVLRSKGIGIAIDDFGTGYSSYSYLKRFPIDILKIDKSFIDDVPYKKDAMAIVKAIISMSEILGYQILAEGVEYVEQANFLKQEKCHYYQGYLKSKPLQAEQFTKLLKS